MNPNPPFPAPDDSLPPDDSLEVQVTALLLGELPATEAEVLRARIAADPALRTLHDRLRIAIELTREVSRAKPAKELPRHEAPRLDPARRDQLLARFRTPATPDNVLALPSRPARRSSNRREWLAMAAMLVVLLAAASGVSLFQRDRVGSLAANLPSASGANEGHFHSPSPVADESKDRTLLRRRTSAPPTQPPLGNLAATDGRKSVVQGLADGEGADPAAAARYALSPSPRLGADSADRFDSLARAKKDQTDSKSLHFVYADEANKNLRKPVLGDSLSLGVQPSTPGKAATPPPGIPALNALSEVTDGNGRSTEPRQSAEKLGRAASPAKELPVNRATRVRDVESFDRLADQPPFERPEVKLGQAVEYDRRDFSTAPEIIASAEKPAASAAPPKTVFDQEPASTRWKDFAAAKGFSQPGNEFRFGFKEAPVAATPADGRSFSGGAGGAVGAALRDFYHVAPPAGDVHWAMRPADPVVRLDSLKSELNAGAARPVPAASDFGTFVASERLWEEHRLAEREKVQTDGLGIANGLSNGVVNGPVNLPVENFSKQLANPAETIPARSLATVAGVQVWELEEMAAQLTAADKSVTDLALIRLEKSDAKSSDAPVEVPPPALSIPQPEVTTAENPFSTFSLNVSDVSFKLTAAALEKGALPAPGSIRTEEFINALDYRDPEPAGVAPVAFTWERARDSFAHNRDLLRFSIKTAATGRQPGKPLNIVLLVDNSGSMERADRVRIRHECLRILAGQLQAGDRISVVAFARTARLWMDGVAGDQAGDLAERIGSLTPEGGTHLEEALDLAYKTARRHFNPAGVNRVVLLTDGAANLGDVSPESLRRRVEDQRRQGVALDCFGIGWEGLNDDLLENLSRNGDGRYGFINTPEAAAAGFAAQLAGALQVAASDVKVQVEFNPQRVTTHRQVGYARHQLKKEQFRDNTVDAAELAAAEAGNALYVAQINPAGSGPIATVRVRFRIPGTADTREHEWTVPYEGSARALDQSSPTLRLAAVASNFAEWLAQSPYAAEVTPDVLLPLLNGVPQVWPADPRPAQLESMIRQARALTGK